MNTLLIDLVTVFVFFQGSNNKTMLGLVASVLTVNTLLIGLVTGLFVYWLIQKFKYKLPPGPIALPLLGNTLRKYKWKSIIIMIFYM